MDTKYNSGVCVVDVSVGSSMNNSLFFHLADLLAKFKFVYELITLTVNQIAVFNTLFPYNTTNTTIFVNDESVNNKYGGKFKEQEKNE